MKSRSSGCVRTGPETHNFAERVAVKNQKFLEKIKQSNKFFSVCYFCYAAKLAAPILEHGNE